jgi:carboxylate-amine ligase
MVYFDARLSRNHPTVEVRIADVCMDAAHATAIAALVRALVECAAQEWRAGTASSGDEEPVTLEVARILSAGTGAHRQRATMMNTQRLTAVVMDAVDRTQGAEKTHGAGPGVSKPPDSGLTGAPDGRPLTCDQMVT